MALRNWIGAGCLFLLAMAHAFAAHAQSKPRDPLVKVTIVSEYAAVQPGQTLWIGMDQDIYPGWHTYWVNAGDAGAPPAIEWDLPEGFVVGPLEFPAPKRVPYLSLMNFGYERRVLLPMQLTVPADAEVGSFVLLDGKASWLVCEDICIPEEGTVSLGLRIAEEPVLNQVWGEPLRKAVAGLPVASPWPVRYQLSERTFDLFLEAPDLIEAFKAGMIHEASFFPRQEGLIENAAKQTFDVTEAGLHLSLPRPQGFDGVTFDEVSGLFVFTQDLEDGPQVNAFRFIGQAMAGGGAAPAHSASLSVPLALLFAFLGGLILNVMPCVFPVLFLKAYSIMQKSGKEKDAVRLDGFVYTLGVVASFALLGAVLLALRAGGAAVGWGFQLQSAPVVAFLALLFVVVGLSLGGLFSVGSSLMGVGSGLAEKSGLTGSFFTGVLATVVATPCTAPFMGAAMGFAMTQPAILALLVFIFLGLGMAVPFLAFSFFPSLASHLPKPGPWMERAKQVLAIPMFGAALYLFWVLSHQVSPAGLLGVIAATVLVGGALWYFGVTRSREQDRRMIANGTLGLAVIVFAFLVFRVEPLQSGQDAGPGVSNGMAYDVYAPETVDALVAEGKPVFVNFTAAWCISCLANEKVAFSSGEVRARFAELGVQYLKADWTNRDPEIAKTLASFGRAGVPLYLYYAPGKAEPVVLPQILTPGIVLDVINQD